MTKTPKLRFPGFTDAWEQRKLGDVADFSIKTNSLSRDKLSEDFHEVQNIHYGDILTRVDNILDLGQVTLPSIIDSKISNYSKILLKNGDVIFADAAEDSTVGKAIEIRNLRGRNVVSGLHTIVARPMVIFAPYYMGYYLNSSIYHNQILPLMQGTKVSSISKSNLQSTTVNYPLSIAEQTKIGTFFRQLDELLTLHQRKLDEVKNLKKSLLQKMFPKNGERIPEVRFPEFIDAWEQRKLGEVGFAKSGTGFPDAEQGGMEGIPFFKVSDMNIKGNENNLVVANNYVTDEQIRRKKWNVIDDVPAIFFAKVGAAVMLNRKRLVRLPFLLDNNTMAYIFDKSLWDCDFGKTIFETINLTKLTQVGALPSYNASDVEAIKIYLPQREEQSAIGTFFRQLDELLTLHQRKLEHLQSLKKALLQQMFV